MRAVVVREFGGPEVLQLTDVPDPVPHADQLLLDVHHAGINYADTHQAEDSYLAAQTLPFIPGSEVAGTAPDGRRVVALVSGGYAQKALAAPQTTFALPAGVSDGAALALVLQGLTAWHLLRTSAHLAPGESVVVSAAAGGVGTLAVQLAKAWGAGRVIATASTPEKRAVAVDLGADAAVDPGVGDLTGALVEANDGRRVDVVLEMTGGAVFDASLAALAPFGRLVSFGLASRTPPSPIEPRRLMARSTGVIGFWLGACLRRPDMLTGPMAELLSMVAADELRPVVSGTYPLSQVRRAHEDLRARRTTGKLLLDPAR